MKNIIWLIILILMSGCVTAQVCNCPGQDVVIITDTGFVHIEPGCLDELNHDRTWITLDEFQQLMEKYLA